MRTTATPRIITINGQKYAPSNAAFMSALFTPGGTCAGEYRVRKNGVLLLDLQGKPFAFVVSRANESPWIVTAFRQDDGRTRYMYGMTETTKKLLGVQDEHSYSESRRLAVEIVDQVSAGN